MDPRRAAFAKLSTHKARAQPDLLLALGAYLGLDPDPLQAWLAPIHGRTKLPNALGRLWPFLNQLAGPAPRDAPARGRDVPPGGNPGGAGVG